ncbi:MAG TPA: ATP-binding cassette domain-containing protein [Acidimicrobiales bacterium]
MQLTRQAWGSGRGRTWSVLIDGSVVGSISNQETIDLPIEPGRHALRVRSMRFLLSPEQSFEAAEGQVIGFSCQSKSRHPFIAQRSIFWGLISLFKHDVWINLESQEADETYDATTTEFALSQPPGTDAEGPPPAPISSVRAQAVARLRSTEGHQGESALVVDQLTKRFGGRTAFSEVSFNVAYGEVFGFLGPNGAGKTTTVRTLGTLIQPTSGSATVAGIPLSPDNGVEVRQRISIMPEAPGLYLRLTVTENLEYFAALYGLHKPGARITDALEAVNLADRANDLCGGLSKGLRQRVGLARTLMSDPAIMFLDEPTSGLDPVAAREVHDLIIALRQQGVTIFLTTHRLDEAEKLCDRVAILNTTLRTVGRPEELRAQLFQGALAVRTLAPLEHPDQLFSRIPAVESWHSDDPGTYQLSVSDPRVAAPQVTRGLVEVGADVLSISEVQHSLEDVYLELVNEDVEARRS